MRLLQLTPLTLQHALLAFAFPSPSRRQATAPATYTANPSVGGGASFAKESAHFRVYNTTASTADVTLKFMEAAHQCFVTELGWRTPGLSIKSGGVGKEVGPWYKMNIYSVAGDKIPGAAAQTWTDGNAGLEYLIVVDQYMTVPDVVVHEFGHAMHYSEEMWIDQGRTGAWWETIANFIADLYLATPTCASAKTAAGLSTSANSIINLNKVIGDSFQVLVDGTAGSGNYYEAWPFLSYISNNPDNYSGLGKTVLLDMIRKYKTNSNETPLHSLERLLSGVTIQKVVGRYWAHMAYVDIGHAKAQAQFTAQRKNLNYANLDSNGNGKYTVKSARAPRYMGANLIPLKATASTVNVAITASASTYTATLSVKGSSATRYVDLVNGNASVTLASGEDVSLVVANTPALALYDAFSIPADLNRGLTYSVQITGATA